MSGLTLQHKLGALQSDGTYPMTGFVSAIPPTVSADPATRRLVVDYFGVGAGAYEPFSLPRITPFATVGSRPCRRAPKPNRLMSMSGFSMIDVNHDLLPNQYLVYDWLNDHKVSWRVYHQGIPFFTMMDRVDTGNSVERSFPQF